MNRRLILLAERRERLVARAVEQRLALTQHIEPWRLPLAFADWGVTALRYTLRQPQWLVGGVILLTLLRPRRVGIWVGRALVAWQMLDRLRHTLHTPLQNTPTTDRLLPEFECAR
jgi:hypothetical protein